VQSGETANSNLIDFSLTRQELEAMIYHTQGEHANHYTTDAISSAKDSLNNKTAFTQKKYPYMNLHKA